LRRDTGRYNTTAEARYKGTKNGVNKTAQNNFTEPGEASGRT
jgi:hypothetical protein